MINSTSSLKYAIKLFSYIPIHAETGLSEFLIARTCLSSLKEGDQLIIGNSMLIRDVDMFTSTSDVKIKIYANRGASGIDGLISTGLGVAKGKDSQRSLLLIGDLSFYHDMNGLLASQHGMDLTIVVIDGK